MTREPWFRATWTGFMPVHRIGWLITLGAAAIVVVLIAAGTLLYLATPHVRLIAVPGAIAFAVLAAVFAVAFTRTKWG